LSVVAANPVGIVPGFHDAPTGGNSITQVTILAGDSDSEDCEDDCQDAYVDQPTTTGTYQVQVDLPGVGTWISEIQTVSAPTLQFFDYLHSNNTGPAIAGKGLTNAPPGFERVSIVDSSGQVVNVAAPVIVNLTSSDPTKATVPATLTIPAGGNSATFQVSGVDLTTTPVTINATAPGYTSPIQPLSVNVVTPVLKFNMLDGVRTTASGRDDFYVSWSIPNSNAVPVAITTQVLNLSIAAPNPFGIVSGFHDAITDGNAIAQATIPAGYNDSRACTSTCTYVYVDQPTATGTYQVQAGLPGVGTWTTSQLTVLTPTLQFYDLGHSNSSGPVVVGKGMTSFLVETEIVAYANGSPINVGFPVTVNLSCVAATVCTVPATVTIPGGQSTANFAIQGVDLGSTQVVASATGFTATQNLNVSVVTPSLLFFGLPSALASGQSVNFGIQLTVPGGYGTPTSTNAVTINLVSASSSVATVPTTATIAAGGSLAFPELFQAVSAGTTTITASSAGFSPVTSPTITVQ
jgi:hypothetical protein